MRKSEYIKKTSEEKKEIKKKDNEEKEQRISDIINSYLDDTVETGSFASIRWTPDNLNPRSIATGELYKGGNSILLTQRIISENWEDNRFLTHNKLNSINFERKQEGKEKIMVKQKGEFTTPIKFVSVNLTEDYYKEQLKNEKLEPKEREKIEKKLEKVQKSFEETGEKPYYINTGYHSMYNVSQLNPEILNYFPEKKSETNLQMGTEAYTNYLIKALKETSHVPIIELKLVNETAFRGNKITMPPQENFVNDRHYLATLAHEVSHSLQEENEKKETKQEFKLNTIQNYAVEEMKAEMSAGITLVKLGINIESSDPEKNIFGTNKAYIEKYAKEIKEHEKKNELFKSVSSSALERSNKILERVKEYEKTYSFEDFKKEYNYDDKVELLEQRKNEIGINKKEDDKAVHFYATGVIDALIDDAISNINFRFEIENIDMNDINKIDEVTRSTIISYNEAMQDTEFPEVNKDTFLLEAKKDVLDSAGECHLVLSDDSMRKLNVTINAYAEMLNKVEPIIIIPKDDLKNYSQSEIEKEKKKLIFKGIDFDEDELNKRTGKDYLESYKEAFCDKLSVVTQLSVCENLKFKNAENEIDSLGEIVGASYNQVTFEYSPNELLIQNIGTSISNILKEVQEYENRKETNEELGLEVSDEIFEKKTLLKVLGQENSIINKYLDDDTVNFKYPSDILEKNRKAYFEITQEQKDLAINEKLGGEKGFEEKKNEILKTKEKDDLEIE